MTIEQYHKLPKKGKPNENEWTILASVVQTTQDLTLSKGFQTKVVSIGTGTKCLNRTQLRKEGDLVIDSHAEIIAKRAFQRFVSIFVSMIISFQKSTKNTKQDF